MENGANYETTPENDIKELAVLIPKEIERVEEQQIRLQTELEAMQSLLSIVGKEMLAGISDKNSNEEPVGQRVWNMMTEFRVNIDLEQQVIKRDIHRIEN